MMPEMQIMCNFVVRIILEMKNVENFVAGVAS